MSSGWISRKRRIAIYTRDNFQCVYCGSEVQQQVGKLSPGASKLATLDHVQPRSVGGLHEVTNLVCSCQSCNSSRKDTPLFEYLAGDVEKIMVVIRQAEKEMVK